nr:MAG TPA: hypothetical protein [Caudoviricetes sp.]
MREPNLQPHGCSVFYEGAEIRRYMEKNYGLVAKYA